MFFRVLTGAIPLDARNCVYLIVDNWDDWFSFRTMFSLFVIDEQGGRHQIGSVKIGRSGLQGSRETSPGFRTPEVPAEFDELPVGFFSLGQGEDYYQSLNNLVEAQRLRILRGLHDCAFDLQIFEAARNEPSMSDSLLRSVSAASVTGRLHRLTLGDAELTEYRFTYTLPPSGPDFAPPTMTFQVTPESEPPSNVHVLIGRNGVGKTRAMRGLMKALLNRVDDKNDSGGRIVFAPLTTGESEFSSLVLVSFSAFDDFYMIPNQSDPIPVEHVGLRQQIMVNGVEQGGIKAPKDLAVDFRKSLDRCRTGLRTARWLETVEILEVDDLFAEADIGELIRATGDDWGAAAEHRFGLLSSGHAVVLLTITRLVELVDERTLVLIDEPEGHLHPPLLSAFIRSLSKLLVSRNGVAMVATHSPVVLQEVPRSCSWKLRRSGWLSEVERPTVETFGENVGTLTREVFGLEVTRTGFHRMLANAVFDRGLSYDEVVAQFGGQLGAEAKAIVRALVMEREQA